MTPEGWQKAHISDLIASLDAGVSVNGMDRQKCDGEVGVLKVSAVTYGVFNPKANKAVIKEDICRVKESPQRGHIIVSRSNSPELVAASALVDKDYPDLFLSDKLWQLKPKSGKQFCVEWLAFYLDSPPVRYRLSKLATGTSDSMKNISKTDLLRLKVNFPPFAEQKEIAKILSCYSSSIDLTERLIAAKQERRTWLMQQLLTGQRRLPGFECSLERHKTPFGTLPADWAYPRIGEVAKEVSERNGDETGRPVLSCTKHKGLVDSLAYFGKQIFSEDLSNYKVVCKDHFAYATNHIDEGSIGYQQTYDEALISPIYTVFQTDKTIDDRFLFLILKTETYRHIFASNTSASVDRRGSLRWSDFAKIHVPRPSMEEQQAIVAVFETDGRELDLLRTQLDALLEQKKGLMQQLLTGKVRVKV
jgi:restriction endonuclease S subunit